MKLLTRLKRGALRRARKRRKAGLVLADERRAFRRFLSDAFDADVDALEREYRTATFRTRYKDQVETLRDRGFGQGVTSDFDCKSLYLLVRAAQPERVVETGVLYGASSAHILQALEENGAGQLHSVDLPNGEDEPPQAFLVPDRIRDRWTLSLADAREALPEVLDELGTIDMFFHDSRHTPEHMSFEYERAAEHLGEGGLLTSHDVVDLPLVPSTFTAFCRGRGWASESFRALGVAVVGSGR